MKRLAAVLFLSASFAIATAESPADEDSSKDNGPAKEESVGWRTMVIAAALLLSPLFAGWALGRRGSKR
jgi:hypothetical protein